MSTDHSDKQEFYVQMMNLMEETISLLNNLSDAINDFMERNKAEEDEHQSAVK